MTDPLTDRSAVTLRPAAPADADAIASLFTDEGYPAGPSDIVARLERFASPHSRVVVAEHDGAILGFIAVHALPAVRARRPDPADPRAGRGRRAPASAASGGR